jgi:hypothetical protein
MLRVVTATSRVAALVGVLAALPGIARVAQLSKSATHAKDGSLLLDDRAEVLELLGGEGLDSQGLNLATVLPRLMGLNGASVKTTLAKPKPSRPMTVIHYRGVSADAEDTDVRQLPPGANATIIDGRLQIYYPSGTSPRGP